MAVPKAKTSKWRRDQRRAKSFFERLKPPSLSKCPSCGEMILPHRVCPYCGEYRGRKVIEVE